MTTGTSAIMQSTLKSGFAQTIGAKTGVSQGGTNLPTNIEKQANRAAAVMNLSKPVDVTATQSGDTASASDIAELYAQSCVIPLNFDLGKVNGKESKPKENS